MEAILLVEAHGTNVEWLVFNFWEEEKTYCGTSGCRLSCVPLRDSSYEDNYGLYTLDRGIALFKKYTKQVIKVK